MPRGGRFVYFLALVMSSVCCIFIVCALGLHGQNVTILRRKLLSRRLSTTESNDGKDRGYSFHNLPSVATDNDPFTNLNQTSARDARHKHGRRKINMTQIQVRNSIVIFIVMVLVSYSSSKSNCTGSSDITSRLIEIWIVRVIIMLIF